MKKKESIPNLLKVSIDILKSDLTMFLYPIQIAIEIDYKFHHSRYPSFPHINIKDLGHDTILCILFFIHNASGVYFIKDYVITLLQESDANRSSGGVTPSMSPAKKPDLTRHRSQDTEEEVVVVPDSSPVSVSGDVSGKSSAVSGSESVSANVRSIDRENVEKMVCQLVITTDTFTSIADMPIIVNITTIPL